MVSGFSMVLHAYDGDAITKAFMKWMREKRELPTPHDILQLCEKDAKNKSEHSPELIAARNATLEKQKKKREQLRQSSEEMPEEEFENWLHQAIEDLKPEKEKKKIHKPDYSHFEKMPKSVQDKLKASLKNPKEQGSRECKISWNDYYNGAKL